MPSHVFVSIHTIPGWLQTFARNQPVTFVANGAVWKTAVWIIIILIIFVPLPSTSIA